MAAAATGKKKYTLLGKGSYGAVFEPAFPNSNDDGNRVEFPGYVTKVFSDEDMYDKAWKNAAALEKNQPELHIPYAKYKKNIKVQNLNAESNTLRKNIGLQARAYDTMKLLMIRMPHKGYSFSDIVHKFPAYRDAFKALPDEVKIREVYKLMNLVKGLGDAGQIHGDIREPNILLNVDAGIMSLIDFDLLMPREKFIDDFPSPFYHIPPEAAMLVKPYDADFERGCLQGTLMPSDYFDTKVFARARYYYNLADFHPGFDGEVATFADTYKTQVMSASSDAEIQKIKKRAEDAMLETVDSFSLAYCLRYLFTHDDDSELKTFLLNILFPSMMHGDQTKRMKIEDAMKAFREFAETKYAIALPAPTTRAAVKVMGAAAAEMAALAAAAGGTGAGAAGAAVAVSSNADAFNAVEALASSAKALEKAPAPGIRTGSNNTKKRREQRQRAKTRNAAGAAAAAGSAATRNNTPPSDQEIAATFGKFSKKFHSEAKSDEINATGFEFVKYVRQHAEYLMKNNPAIIQFSIIMAKTLLRERDTSKELKESCKALLAVIEPAAAKAKGK